MLVTLLLLNAFAMETLPIFLDKIMTTYQAILVSVTGILFLGEIIPQAVCTGPNQVEIATFMAPIGKFLMRVTSPISWPIAKLLDKIMGEHETPRFNNDQLKHLIELHTEKELNHIGHEREKGEDIGLAHQQAQMIAGALTLESLTIGEFGEAKDKLLIPVADLKFFSLDTVLDSATIESIRHINYSRFPIMMSDKYQYIIAILMAKSLIGLEPSNKTIRQLFVN